jgi:hypothetical protein
VGLTPEAFRNYERLLLTEMDLRRRLGMILLLFSIGLFGSRAYGQAIIAPAGRTVFHGESMIRTFTEIENLSVRTPDEQSIEVTRYVTPLALVYGFHPNWEVIAVQPYLVANVTTLIASEMTSRSLNGLADSQFFVQYDGLYSRNTPGGLTRLSGVFGVEAPTGARRFSTGAFEYTFGTIFEKVAKLHYAFTSDFQYTIATTNSQGLSVGNKAQFDAVPAYFLIPHGDLATDASLPRKAFERIFGNGAYLMLEFNGTWLARAQQNGTDLPNSGGTTLCVSPGIQYFISRRFLVEFSIPIPVVTSLNGAQPRPRFAALIGFRLLF